MLNQPHSQCILSWERAWNTVKQSMRLMQPDQACVFVDCSLKTTALRGGLPICCTHAAAAHCPKRRHSECCMHKPQASQLLCTLTFQQACCRVADGAPWTWSSVRPNPVCGFSTGSVSFWGACRVSRLGTAYLQLQHRQCKLLGMSKMG